MPKGMQRSNRETKKPKKQPATPGGPAKPVPAPARNPWK